MENWSCQDLCFHWLPLDSAHLERGVSQATLCGCWGPGNLQPEYAPSHVWHTNVASVRLCTYLLEWSGIDPKQLCQVIVCLWEVNLGTHFGVVWPCRSGECIEQMLTNGNKRPLVVACPYGKSRSNQPWYVWMASIPMALMCFWGTREKGFGEKHAIGDVSIMHMGFGAWRLNVCHTCMHVQGKKCHFSWRGWGAQRLSNFMGGMRVTWQWCMLTSMGQTQQVPNIYIYTYVKHACGHIV